MKINTKMDFKVLIMFIIAVIVVCTPYLFGVYSADGYSIEKHGLEEFKDELAYPNNRIIQGLMYEIIVPLNLEYMTLYRIFVILTGVLFVIAMYLFYNEVKKRLLHNNLLSQKESTIKKYGLVLGVIALFLNRYVADNLVYLENINMMAAMLLVLIAAIVYVNNVKGRNIIVAILMIFSVLTYQTFIAMLPVLVIFFDSLNRINDKNEFSIKDSLKYTFKLVMNTCLFYILALIVSFIVSLIMPLLGFEILDRYIELSEIVPLIIKLIDTIGVLLITVSPYIIVSTILVYLNITKNGESDIILKKFIYNICVISAVALIFTGAFGVINIGLLSNRMAFTLGMIPAMIYIYLIITIDMKSKRLILIGSIIVVVEILILFYTYYLDYSVNVFNKEESNYIKNEIEIYEQDMNINIEYIKIIVDDNYISKQTVIHYVSSYNDSVLDEVLEYFNPIYSLLKEYEEKPDMDSKEVYSKYFDNEDLDNIEIVFEDNTAYICMP